MEEEGVENQEMEVNGQVSGGQQVNHADPSDMNLNHRPRVLFMIPAVWLGALTPEVGLPLARHEKYILYFGCLRAKYQLFNRSIFLKIGNNAMQMKHV